MRNRFSSNRPVQTRGRDSWTARWQKRTRREAFDCDDWFGGGIRRGPQSGCGQSSRIAGKQERSSSQVTLELSPDLEVGGACAQQGGAGERPIRIRSAPPDYSGISSTRREAWSAFISASTAGSYLPAASSRGSSYKFPADTPLRLRRGSDVLIKTPADRERARIRRPRRPCEATGPSENVESWRR